MTINVGIARGGPEDGRIIVHIGEEKDGFELRKTGRYVFDRATTDWEWKEDDMGRMKEQLGDEQPKWIGWDFGKESGRSYPHAPGFKEPTTSRDAASAMKGRANKLREVVFTAIADAPDGLTADEVASLIGETVLAVRPRVSELAKADRIAPTGERRKNASGLKARVWRTA